MIKDFADLAVAPETYADYRPIFETKRLNMTHVRIHPGETSPRTPTSTRTRSTTSPRARGS
jgi:hypothetical protein